MTEVLNKSPSGPNARLLHGSPTQRTPRARLGQTRASKRSIADYKRGSHRVHKGQKSENAHHESTVTSQTATRENDIHETKSTPVSLSHSTSKMDSPPNSSPESLSDVQPANRMTEYKRPRPEVHSNSGGVLANLSSSAPPGCMRDSGALLFDANRCGQFRDCPRHFVCTPSLVDDQRLQHLLSRETHYHPNNAFLYYVNPELEDKVDAALRNEAVHNLRFMHNAVFNLSTETFCKAVNLIDRFIVKVKVKPKYMACVATASYCVASKLCHSNKEVDLPNLDTLVSITRCGGNAADLVRMEEILASKLSQDLDGVNAFDFLQLFSDSLVPTTTNAGAFVSPTPPTSCDNPFLLPQLPDPDQQHPSKIDDDHLPLHTETTKATGIRKVHRSHMVKRLMTRLEIILCSLEAYRFRPACLALGIMAQLNVKGLVPLASMCGVDWTDVLNCASLVEELYEIYYRDPLPCIRRPLVTTLSRRTLLRIGYSCPTPLDTITEDCEPAEEDEWLLPLLFEP